MAIVYTPVKETRLNYHRGNYDCIRKSLQNIDWNQRWLHRTVEEMWQDLVRLLKEEIDRLSTEKGINLSLMLAATNLFTITDYKGLDPEAYSNRGGADTRGADGGSYPNSRTYTFGVNLNF